MDPVITKITYYHGQGEATKSDWEAFNAYAEAQLRATYPDADIDVDMVDQETDTYLTIETREEEESDSVGLFWRAEQEAEAFVGHLWDDFCRLSLWDEHGKLIRQP